VVREHLKGIAMNPETLRQIRGAKDLLEEAIEALAVSVGDAHRKMARQPYALLARIEPIAAPVRAIEEAHLRITDGVYFSIRLGNRLVGVVAGFALDRIEGVARPK
jgi:hypothetical protein